MSNQALPLIGQTINSELSSNLRDRTRTSRSRGLPVTSSEPPELPQEQEALFREVLLTLEEKRVPFAVSGAFALQEHTGICRWTKDVDIFLTAKNASLALRYLEGCGFACEVRDPVWLNKAHRDDFFVDLSPE